MKFDWNILISILSGLAVCIPLVIKLVQSVQSGVKEKNWDRLLQMVMQYMAEAEKNISNGATRKEWVMGMLDTAAKTCNYDLTDEERAKMSTMIDSMCDMAKTVNAQENGAA